jgi:hypothetical protein
MDVCIYIENRKGDLSLITVAANNTLCMTSAAEVQEVMEKIQWTLYLHNRQLTSRLLPNQIRQLYLNHALWLVECNQVTLS